MTRKRRTHLRGRRGQAFADLIRGIVPEQILCVSIDISKDFHVVLLHNGLGEIITPSFEIDIFRSGFRQLYLAIDEGIVSTNARVILVGMEPTGHYYENLARHIQATGQVAVSASRSIWNADLWTSGSAGLATGATRSTAWSG